MRRGRTKKAEERIVRCAPAGLGVFPIKSLRKLEWALSIPRSDLCEVAARAAEFYRERTICRRGPDGSAKKRKIEPSFGALKRIQYQIHRALLKGITFPEAMHGGIPGRSIVSYAEDHAGKYCVVTLDLKDCFTRTSFRSVYHVFRHALGCVPRVAGVLTRLTTYRGHVPQGAPTSTAVCNLALLPLHYDLLDLAGRLGLRFSQFVDDIAFSGRRAREAIGPAVDLIRAHGHAVRARKTKCMPAFRSQRVAGVVVNRKMSAGGGRIALIRERIRMLDGADDGFEKELQSIRGTISFIRFLSVRQGDSVQKFLAMHLEKLTVPAAL